MEGHGVTNYHVDRPSYAYKASSTTQFDDALLQHGIVNRTQTIVAKGATVEHAQELLQVEQEQKNLRLQEQQQQQRPWWSSSNDKEDDSDDDDDDLLLDNDDEVMQRYRQLRLAEYLQHQQQERTKSALETISRDDWMEKVNQASWQEDDGTTSAVVVCLTTTSSLSMEFVQSCTVLAQRYGGGTSSTSTRFVTLPATEALRDWPHPEPSLLVYRQGSLWREFFRLTAVSVADLETTLAEVIEGTH